MERYKEDTFPISAKILPFHPIQRQQSIISSLEGDMDYMRQWFKECLDDERKKKYELKARLKRFRFIVLRGDRAEEG